VEGGNSLEETSKLRGKCSRERTCVIRDGRKNVSTGGRSVEIICHHQKKLERVAFSIHSPGDVHGHLHGRGKSGDFSAAS